MLPEPCVLRLQKERFGLNLYLKRVSSSKLPPNDTKRTHIYAHLVLDGLPQALPHPRLRPLQQHVSLLRFRGGRGGTRNRLFGESPRPGYRPLIPLLSEREGICLCIAT